MGVHLESPGDGRPIGNTYRAYAQIIDMLAFPALEMMVVDIQMAALVSRLPCREDDRVDKFALLEQVDRAVYRGDSYGFRLSVLFPFQ